MMTREEWERGKAVNARRESRIELPAGGGDGLILVHIVDERGKPCAFLHINYEAGGDRMRFDLYPDPTHLVTLCHYAPSSTGSTLSFSAERRPRR